MRLQRRLLFEIEEKNRELSGILKSYADKMDFLGISEGLLSRYFKEIVLKTDF